MQVTWSMGHMVYGYTVGWDSHVGSIVAMFLLSAEELIGRIQGVPTLLTRKERNAPHLDPDGHGQVPVGTVGVR